jgi:hypothetical protein
VLDVGLPAKFAKVNRRAGAGGLCDFRPVALGGKAPIAFYIGRTNAKGVKGAEGTFGHHSKFGILGQSFGKRVNHVTFPFHSSSKFCAGLHQRRLGFIAHLMQNRGIMRGAKGHFDLGEQPRRFE